MLFCVGELQENCRDLLTFLNSMGLNCIVKKLMATSERGTRVIRNSPCLTRLNHKS